MGQFSNSFPKHFSYLCEYAFICDLSCSICEYPIIFHCLHCSPSCFDPDPLLFTYYWLGLSWIDSISANKRFSSSKTSSRKPYTNSKQQERQKHSAENTINFSTNTGVLHRTRSVHLTAVRKPTRRPKYVHNSHVDAMRKPTWQQRHIWIPRCCEVQPKYVHNSHLDAMRKPKWQQRHIWIAGCCELRLEYVQNSDLDAMRKPTWQQRHIWITRCCELLAPTVCALEP